jgi:hypothetical protein
MIAVVQGGRAAHRFSRDSPLEGTGFEPSVPRKAPGVVVVCRFPFAPNFPLAGNQAEVT